MSTNLEERYLTNAGITVGDEHGNMEMPPKNKARSSVKEVEDNNPITKQLSNHVAFRDENGNVVGRAALDEKGNVVLISGELSAQQLNEAKAMLLAIDKEVKQPAVEFEFGE